MSDILPFAVSILHLGDLNIDAASATSRPRADTAWAIKDIRNRISTENHEILLSSTSENQDAAPSPS